MELHKNSQLHCWTFVGPSSFSAPQTCLSQSQDNIAKLSGGKPCGVLPKSIQIQLSTLTRVILAKCISQVSDPKWT